MTSAIRADTASGLALIVILGFVFSPILLPAIMLTCAAGIVFIAVGSVWDVLHFFYRGFCFGDWPAGCTHPSSERVGEFSLGGRRSTTDFGL